MRILLVPSLPFDELGGVSTHVHMLSEGLQALGETVHIVDEWPPWIYRIPLVRLPCVLLDKASRQLSLRWELAARHLYYLADGLLATGMSPDIINIQNVMHMPMAVHLRRLTGCRVVLTVHGRLANEAEAMGVAQGVLSRYRYLETTGYAKAGWIVVVSSSTAAHVEGFPHAPISVIHNGIDTRMFSPSQFNAELRDQAEGGLRLLFAGFLEPHKGILDAVEVVAGLREVGIQAELAAAGVGSEQEPGRLLAERKNIAGRVKWLGTIRKTEMPAFYRSGDLLLIPSKPRGSGRGEESFPYTALEAMASGLPVVAYDQGGLAEQIKDGSTGFIVPTGDVQALTNAAKKLADPDLRRRMSKMARNRVESEFSALEMARKFVDIYKSE